MGLFGSKKKKKFYTAVQRMIEDKAITPSSKNAVASYLFEGGMSTSVNSKSLPDYLIEAAQNNMPTKYKQGYRYADKGHYAFGLPRAESTRAGVGVEARIQQIIEAEVDNPITPLYARLEEANYYHFMWQLLIKNYGYNPTSNELENLTAEKGFTCYLTSAQIFYTDATMQAVLDASYLDQWGLPAEFGPTLERAQDFTRPQLAYQTDPAALQDYAKIKYEYLEVIPDTTNPAEFKASFFDGLVLKGVGEIGAKIQIKDVDDLVLAEGLTDETGYFEVTLEEEATEVFVYVVDTAENSSEVNLLTAPFEDPDNEGIVGETPTQTEFKREEEFTFDFLEYISSNTESDTDVYSPEPDYIMACYTYELAGKTEIKFLTYAFGSGLNPAYEEVLQYAEATGEFFPRLYARLDGDNLTGLSKTDPRYKTSVKFAKKLGIDWVGWVKQLHDSIDNVGDVQQLFMTLCAPLNTSDPVIAEYLFRYFYKIYHEIEGYAEGSTTIKQGMAFNIRDTAYSHIVSFSGLELIQNPGNVTQVGKYTTSYVGDWESPYHSVKFQVSATEYVEIKIYGASSRHNFGGNGTSVSGTDEALVFPLDRSIIPKMTTTELELLFGKCLYIFINVIKVIKVKWYQTGIFKVIMVVIAIVVSFFFPPAAVVAYGYLAVAAYAIAVSIAISLVVQVLAKVLVKLGVNSGLVAVIAVIIAIIAIAVGGGASIGEILNTSANTLLQVSNAAFQLSSQMSQMYLKETVKQMEAFQAQAKSKWELLEEAQKLLETGTMPLSLETLMSDLRSKVLIRLGESPDIYLTRTIGLGNVGTMAFDMVSNYVDNTLVLPDLNTTMQQTQRG